MYLRPSSRCTYILICTWCPVLTVHKYWYVYPIPSSGYTYVVIYTWYPSMAIHMYWYVPDSQLWLYIGCTYVHTDMYQMPSSVCTYFLLRTWCPALAVQMNPYLPDGAWYRRPSAPGQWPCGSCATGWSRRKSPPASPAAASLSVKGLPHEICSEL